MLESYGIGVALEAEIPVAGTSVGGTLIALLEAELGSGRVAELLRFMRGPSGLPPAQVDWFERAVRRRRLVGATAALGLWEERHERLRRGRLRLTGSGWRRRPRCRRSG